MHPDALNQAKEKHTDHDKGSRVADKRKWDSGYRCEENAHSDTLEEVGKEKTNHTADDDSPREVTAVKSDKETLNQKKSESCYEKS